MALSCCGPAAAPELAEPLLLSSQPQNTRVPVRRQSLEQAARTAAAAAAAARELGCRERSRLAAARFCAAAAEARQRANVETGARLAALEEDARRRARRQARWSGGGQSARTAVAPPPRCELSLPLPPLRLPPCRCRRREDGEQQQRQQQAVAGAQRRGDWRGASCRCCRQAASAPS